MTLRRILTALPLLLLTLAAATAAAECRDSVLHIPAGTRAIPERGYALRQDFHTVVFDAPCRLEKIGAEAFRDCGALRRILLPASLRDIGSRAFAYCFRIDSVSIPEGVTHIGSNAFSFCTSLSSITLPPDMKELESYAFSDCSALREATLPANDALLGEMIFYGCLSLDTLRVPSVTPPPFDCASQPFDLEEQHLFRQCRLLVPGKSVPLYSSAPGWRLFRSILPVNEPSSPGIPTRSN